MSCHTHPFNGSLSGTTRMGRYQKGICGCVYVFMCYSCNLLRVCNLYLCLSGIVTLRRLSAWRST